MKETPDSKPFDVPPAFLTVKFYLAKDVFFHKNLKRKHNMKIQTLIFEFTYSVKYEKNKSECCLILIVWHWEFCELCFLWKVQVKSNETISYV